MVTSDCRPRRAQVEFSIRRFRRDDDLGLVNEWLEMRDLPRALPEDIPDIGFIVWKEGRALAAAFLRNCEGGIGVFDSLITNPKESLFTRHLAIEILIDKIICTAKLSHVRRILAFTLDKGILKRSEKHGFKKQPHAVISLQI